MDIVSIVALVFFLILTTLVSPRAYHAAVPFVTLAVAIIFVVWVCLLQTTVLNPIHFLWGFLMYLSGYMDGGRK